MFLPAAAFLFLNTMYLMLRVSPASGSFPRPLSAEEEREALLKSAAGDIQARNLLIEHNLRLVAHVIKKYYASREDQDDLISIGTFGLIKAISTFDATKGARLATYASRCIENEILMHFRAQRKSAGDVSLSDYIETGKEGNALSLMDVVCTEEDLFEDLETRQTYLRLHRYLRSELTSREQKILILRYGLGGKPPLTQRETAQLCRISRSYVSRIEKRALEKLQAAFSREMAGE